MLFPEPRRGRFELHWRILGGDLRVQLLFWVSCVLVGVIYYQDPKIGGIAAFSFWMIAVVFSLLAHEIGHILAARLFGARTRIVLSGLGGRVFGLEELKRGPRLFIALAGPLVNLLIFGILWASARPGTLSVERLGQEWTTFILNAMKMLMMINAFWAFLNLLPLWPLDGGRIAVDIGESVLGRRGQTLALLLSLAVTVLLMLFVIAWMRLTLINPFDVHYTIYFVYFCILSLYCYPFWLSAFRALWGNSEPPDRTSDSDRAA